MAAKKEEQDKKEEQGTVKVRFLARVRVGDQRYIPGQKPTTAELPADIAETLIALGKAETV